MLFKIYIGMIVFFYIGFLTFVIDMRIKAKNNGLKKNKYKNSGIKHYIQLGIISVIPIFNVYMSFVYIFSKRLEKIVDEQINIAKENQEK